jgi:hypothetical protein
MQACESIAFSVCFNCERCKRREPLKFLFHQGALPTSRFVYSAYIRGFHCCKHTAMKISFQSKNLLAELSLTTAAAHAKSPVAGDLLTWIAFMTDNKLM